MTTEEKRQNKYEPEDSVQIGDPLRSALIRDPRSAIRDLFGGGLFFFFEIVGDPEAIAGGFIHLFGSINGVLQFGNALLDLGEFFFDLILQIVDLLPGDLQGVLVKLPLLIGENRHVPTSE